MFFLSLSFFHFDLETRWILSETKTETPIKNTLFPCDAGMSHRLVRTRYRKSRTNKKTHSHCKHIEEEREREHRLLFHLVTAGAIHSHRCTHTCDLGLHKYTSKYALTFMEFSLPFFLYCKKKPQRERRERKVKSANVNKDCFQEDFLFPHKNSHGSLQNGFLVIALHDGLPSAATQVSI